MRAAAMGLLALAALAACERREPTPNPPRTSSAPEVCTECGARKGPMHVCGVTRFCPICSRDAGDYHLCGRTGFCPTCRREVVARGGPSPHVCGVTELCFASPCAREGVPVEAGPGHVCGKTRLHVACSREGGPEHRCQAGTAFCAVCGMDVLPEIHVHGRTRFCSHPRCLTEVAADTSLHEHGRTTWCPQCRAERLRGHEHPDGQ